MIDKKRWSALKSGIVQPQNDEERNSLEQWRNDKQLEQTYWFNQISEPVRQYRGTTPRTPMLRGFGKSER
jgi:hypothetical protein